MKFSGRAKDVENESEVLGEGRRIVGTSVKLDRLWKKKKENVSR